MDSLFKKLEHLQQQPAHVKKRYAFFITVAIFSVIVVVWISTFSAELDRLERERQGKDSGKTPSMLMKGFFKDIGADISDMKKSMGGEVDYVRSEGATTTISEIVQAFADQEAADSAARRTAATTSDTVPTATSTPN